MEPKNSMLSNDRTGDERNMDTVKALKQQVLKLKKKLKKNKNSSRPKTRSKPARSLSSDSPSTLVEVTKKEESSDGRKKGGKSLGRGSRGKLVRIPFDDEAAIQARRGQETVWKAFHQISHSCFHNVIIYIF